VVEEAEEAEEAEDEEKGKKRHTPGRDHTRKSGPIKKRAFQRKAAKKRQREQEKIRKQWEVWNALPREVQKLRPELKPEGPMPPDEN
jgi:hypothetical protein